MTPNQLRELRARLGLTQRRMADAIGCSLNTYERWEQSKPPDQPLPMLPLYAKAVAKLTRRRPPTE